MDIISTLKSSTQRPLEFISKSLELWDKIGYDHQFGGYFEALDFEGKPLTKLNKRFRIHPRSIFAHVFGSVHSYYDGMEVAEKAFDYITRNYWLDLGGFATLSSREGKILDKTIYTYDHSFVLLGFGWLYYATKNKTHKLWLDRVWDMLNSRLIHADGGFITSIPEPKTPRRVQNPHMHLLEALINLVELFGDSMWIKAAQRLYGLFDKYIFLSHEKRLREFFNDNWSPDIQKGHLLDPGHHYEWVWILQKYEQALGVSTYQMIDLYQFAMKASNDLGLAYNETDYEANPVRPEHRMWIQTEAVKANIAMYKKFNEEIYLTRMHEAMNLLFDKYLIEEHFTWYDELDNNGNNISKNSPCSTLYHLVIAIYEYVTLIESLQ